MNKGNLADKRKRARAKTKRVMRRLHKKLQAIISKEAYSLIHKAIKRGSLPIEIQFSTSITHNWHVKIPRSVSFCDEISGQIFNVKWGGSTR